MNATDIIGWTADADYWCNDCANSTYGEGFEFRKDDEGNDVAPIFASDETPAGAVCTSCGTELTEPAGLDIWALLELDAPAGCSAVQDLYSWSLNFDAGTGPFALFLDIIGWSQDELGTPIYDMSRALMGYVECDKLARALTEYSDRPTDVREYVDTLMAAEAR